MTDVRHDQARQRYVLDTPEGPAVADYERDGDTIVFTHTGGPPAAEGHGTGSTLIAGALADVRAQGLKVVPQCPFVRAYIDRHPDEQDLLAGVR